MTGTGIERPECPEPPSCPATGEDDPAHLTHCGDYSRAGDDSSNISTLLLKEGPLASLKGHLEARDHTRSKGAGKPEAAGGICRPTPPGYHRAWVHLGLPVSTSEGTELDTQL